MRSSSARLSRGRGQRLGSAVAEDAGGGGRAEKLVGGHWSGRPARRVGGVTQHYDIRRPDLAAVLELAAAASTVIDGQHGVTGKLHRDCPACFAVQALGRIRNALTWTAGVSHR